MAREKQPRERRQGPSDDTRTRRRGTVEDALAATHQNSVPVLPAYGSTQRTGAQRSRTLADTTTTATRNTSATNMGRQSGPTGGDQSTGGAYGTYDSHDTYRYPTDYGSPGSPAASGSGSSSGYGSGARYERYDARLPAGVADEVYDADTYEQDAYSRGARRQGSSTSRALVPGRPTVGLPTLPEDFLPAVTGDEAERQLALKTDGASDVPAVLIRGASKPLQPYTPIVPKRQGPRSFMSQFIISMVAVMTMFTVLTLASPLGHSQAFAGTFQSYANAVPWVPTPTPTPKPVVAYAPPAGANPGQQAVINDITAVFGQYASGAINVARCESGFDPNAWNPYAIGGSHAAGVFQILYPSTWSTTSWGGYSPYSYDANIHAAYQIFSRDGYSWREWSCGIYA